MCVCTNVHMYVHVHSFNLKMHPMQMMMSLYIQRANHGFYRNANEIYIYSEKMYANISEGSQFKPVDHMYIHICRRM